MCFTDHEWASMTTNQQLERHCSVLRVSVHVCFYHQIWKCQFSTYFKAVPKYNRKSKFYDFEKFTNFNNSDLQTILSQLESITKAPCIMNS